MPVPDYEAFINQCWQGGGPWLGLWSSCYYGAGSNISAVGGNPPYGVVDFLSIYPQFGPSALPSVTGEITEGANQLILDAAAPDNFIVGLNISGPDLPAGTTVLAIADDTITVTMSTEALATLDETITYYPPDFITTGFVPQAALNAFTALAYASVPFSRYLDTWFMAMGFFIAHYCTLYLRSTGGTAAAFSAGQLATAGLEKGITLQKSAFDVSSGAAQPQGIEDWGTFTETTYGSQFATLGRGAAGMGGVLLR